MTHLLALPCATAEKPLTVSYQRATPRALQDWDACLKEAFLAAQTDLLKLAASEGWSRRRETHRHELFGDVLG